jgi:ATP-dependent RNA helicase DDX27
MDPSFVFDLGDDQQPAAPAQSPWDFGNAAKLVAEQHSQQRTTSVDHKIQQQLRRKSIMRGSGFKDSGGGLNKDESEQEDEVGDDSDEEEEETEEVGGDGNGVGPNGNGVSAGAAEEQAASNDEGSSSEDDELEERWEQRARANSHAEATSSKPAGTDDWKKQKNGRSEEGQAGRSSSGSFFSSAEGASFNARSFGELNISRPLLKACQALGYDKPTPIQSACVPLALTGRDICGSAITGSGKTAAFALPILERLLYRPRRVPATRVLVLTPTRELAVQVHSMIEKLAQFTDIRACLVVGGLSNKVRHRYGCVVAPPFCALGCG